MMYSGVASVFDLEYFDHRPTLLILLDRRLWNSIWYKIQKEIWKDIEKDRKFIIYKLVRLKCGFQSTGGQILMKHHCIFRFLGGW